MEKVKSEEVLQELAVLLEKTAIDTLSPVISDGNVTQQDEAFLISLKAVNARYDKADALAQIKALMEKYNIQIDELLEQIKY
jgi:hypothetical protein